MTATLLQKLEEKVANAIDTIELMRLQVESLEQENATLKAEQEKWRRDLKGLLQRFDQIEPPHHKELEEVEEAEEEYMTV